MTRICSLSILFCLMLAGASAQQSSLTLTFSATNNTDWIRLDSTRITNRTRNCDTVLYYPDTLLALDYSFVLPEPDYSQGKLLVFQNYPNPATDYTIIEIFVPGKDKLNISVSDVTGRVIIQDERTLDFGIHSFRFYPGNGHLYLLTAKWKEYAGSIKILFSALNNSGTCSLVYLPTGMREEIGIHNDHWFHSFGSSGYFWSTTQNTENSSKIYHYFPCIIGGAARGVWTVPAGMSARCLKDK